MTTERPNGGKHRVQLGDDLVSLAERYYGDAGRWTQLWYANRAALANRTALTPGESLIIPAEHLLSTGDVAPGEEPDGFIGPDGLIEAPEPDRSAASGVTRDWSQPPPRATSVVSSWSSRRARSARTPGRPAAQRRSLGEVLGKVPTAVYSIAVVLLAYGVFSIVSPLVEASQLSGPAQLRDLPGVATVDDAENEIRLRREITQSQARAVLDRAFYLEGEWRLILGPASVPIVRGGSIPEPNVLYPPVDLLVRIAADLPTAVPQSITIDGDYEIAASVDGPKQVIDTARALVHVLATDSNGMAINELRVTERTTSRSVVVPEHLAVTRTAELDTTLRTVAQLADFARVEFGERYRVVVRAPSESDFGRACAAAARAFDDHELPVDLEVARRSGQYDAVPCP